MGNTIDVCHVKHVLIAHRMNDPHQVPTVLEAGAQGIEIDLWSDGSTWYVGHDMFSGSISWDDYYSASLRWPHQPDLLYLDIKTPAATNLVDLATFTFPTRHVLFATADGRNAKYFKVLPPTAEVVADFTNQRHAHRYWRKEGRSFWMADGIAAGIPSSLGALKGRSRHKRLAWTYSSLSQWSHDVKALHLDATIVEPSLIPQAYAALQCLSSIS